MCLQSDLTTEDTIGDEDCLFVNVYSPVLQPVTPLPVMMFIHRGFFLIGTGSSAQVGPQRLVSHGVVLVATNYRLGAFGFLSTEDEASPGNYGMKDQIEALRWVQANIKSFGGDPTRVTVFGQSAGSISSLMHMTSPLAKGLFHAIIGESRCATCDCSVTYNPRQSATMLGNMVNCSTTDTRQLVACLRNTPADPIVVATTKINVVRKNFLESMKFQPTLEPANTVGAYLTEYPWIQFQRDNYMRVPVILGQTRNDGYLMYSSISQLYDAWRDDHLSILPQSISRYLPGTKLSTGRLNQTLVKAYFTGDETPIAVERTLVRIYTDASTGRCVDEGGATLTAYGNPTYLFSFNYSNATDATGFVSHMAELQYLFRKNLFPNNQILYGNDIIMSDYMVTMWTNFVKIMVPNYDNSKTTPPRAKWLASSRRRPRYYVIDLNATMANGPLEMNRARFWNRLAHQDTP